MIERDLNPPATDCDENHCDQAAEVYNEEYGTEPDSDRLCEFCMERYFLS